MIKDLEYSFTFIMFYRVYKSGLWKNVFKWEQRRKAVNLLLLTKENAVDFENDNCREEDSKVRQVGSRGHTQEGRRKQEGRGRNIFHHMVKEIYFEGGERSEEQWLCYPSHPPENKQNHEKDTIVHTRTYIRLESSKTKRSSEEKSSSIKGQKRVLEDTNCISTPLLLPYGNKSCSFPDHSSNFQTIYTLYTYKGERMWGLGFPTWKQQIKGIGISVNR